MPSSSQPFKYSPSILIRFFHSRPHWDISFRLINDSFNPQDDIYLESLGLWASAPALILILSLLILLIYLLAYCCRRRQPKQKSYGCLKWVLTVIALLCCASMGAGLYGSEVAHATLLDLSGYIRSISKNFDLAREQSDRMKQNLMNSQPPLAELGDTFSLRPLSNVTAMGILTNGVEDMKENVSLATRALDSVNDKIARAKYDQVSRVIELVEEYRWPGTMGVYCVLISFCAVLLIGLARRSRCTLMLFSVMGLLSTVFTGLLVCFYFVLAMALSDLCVAPDMYIANQARHTVSREVVNYYIGCKEETSGDGPFGTAISAAHRAITNIQRVLADVSRTAEGMLLPHEYPQLTYTLANLGQTINTTYSAVGIVADQLECRTVAGDYEMALESGCNHFIFALTILLFSAAGACFFFYLLVILDSHVWIYMRKRSAGYLRSNEENSPFLPPESSNSLGRRSHASSSTYGLPPPAYSSQTYNTQTPSYRSATMARNGRDRSSGYSSGTMMPMGTTIRSSHYSVPDDRLELPKSIFCLR
ncbi:unnamed protein product [Cyprideis torosa]|uniref:Protein tweety homolog n=1 Tax=Cyprideis torosa TaxID=163714 RepID=A0A7R8ZJW3_9CRUS|nr:unnamed protein product [Cyprideis torosa]CAG0879077.1 unnamed protein product [Cyprideis torosa]